MTVAALAALALLIPSAIAIYEYRHAIDWDDLRLTDDSADVIDAWALVPLDESPIFLQMVADLPVAGEMAVRFAAEVEQYVKDAS